MENNKNHQALNAKPPIAGSNVQIRSKSSPGKNTSLHDLAAARLVKIQLRRFSGLHRFEESQYFSRSRTLEFITIWRVAKSEYCRNISEKGNELLMRFLTMDRQPGIVVWQSILQLLSSILRLAI